MWPNGQSVRCVQARCGGLLSDLEVGWNPWTSLVVRHSGTAARGGRRGGSDYGTAEVLVRVLPGVESRRTDGGARPRGCDGGSVSRFRM